MRAKITLITSLYHEKNPVRRDELLFCLNDNIKNKLIDNICVLFDGYDNEDSLLKKEVDNASSIHIEKCDGKPAFNFIFSIAQRLYPDDIVIIANSDIIYDTTLSLLQTIDFKSNFAVLSRYNKSESGNWDLIKLDSGVPNYFSFDSFIFKPDDFSNLRCNMRLGSMYCDSFLAKQLYNNSKYHLLNPCLDIKSYHIQKEISLSQIFSSESSFKKNSIAWRNEYVRNLFSTPISGCVWSYLKDNDIYRSHEVIWKSKYNIFIEIDSIDDLDKILSVDNIAHLVSKPIWIYSQVIEFKELASICKNISTNCNPIAELPDKEDLVVYDSGDLSNFLMNTEEKSVLIQNDKLKISIESNKQIPQDPSIKKVLYIVTDQNPSRINISDKHKTPKVEIRHSLFSNLKNIVNQKPSEFSENESRYFLFLRDDSVIDIERAHLVMTNLDNNPDIILSKSCIKLGNKHFYCNPNFDFKELLKHWQTNNILLSLNNFIFSQYSMNLLNAEIPELSNQCLINFLLENYNNLTVSKSDQIICTQIKDPNKSNKTKQSTIANWSTSQYKVIDKVSQSLESSVLEGYRKARDEAYMYFNILDII